MNSLQRALFYNAAFSATSGLLLIFFHQSLAGMFQVNESKAFWIVGVALLYFTTTLLLEMKKQRALAVLWIIMQDILWVIGSLLIIMLDLFSISQEGHYLIAAVALIVLVMAINQSRQLMKVDEETKEGVKIWRFTQDVNTPKEVVWETISDISNYHEVAPNIDQVKIISGSEEGLVRACSHGDDSWTETCTLWDEGKRYSFEVDTTPKDYPYPFKYLKGSWEVEALSPARSRIMMIFEFRYKQPYQKLLVHPLLTPRFKKIAKDLLENWQKKMEYVY